MCPQKGDEIGEKLEEEMNKLLKLLESENIAAAKEVVAVHCREATVKCTT